MELKTFGIEFGAIMVSYLLLMLPVVGATDVNIMFGGEVKDTTEISPSKIVNRVIEVVHDPTDITWANVKVRVSVSSASLAKSIDKIYLFTCKNQNPVDCVKGKPLEFENYIDEELNWVDISAQTGAGFYPQTANILLLVKLQGERTTWTGFWDKIERLDYNVFGTYSYEISSINVDAKSLDLVAPIKAYIQNYQMIPFTWVNQVYFEGANFLYSVGADEDEIEKVQNLVWHTAQPETNYITSVAKELSFLLPVTASGINNIVPVNKNPSYVCGNGVCEADLGETFDNCCHDCVCEAGKYCDLPEGSTAGTCRSIEQTELEIISPTPQITDCTQPFNVNLEVRVKNPPMSLGKEATATITINDTAYPVVCTKMAGGYSCPLTLKPWVGCGAASYTVGPNHIDLIVTYKNGPNDVTKDFSEDFDDLSANFNCPCTQEGYYCESGSKTCRPLGSISLGIVSVKSYFTTFNPAGDNIDLTLQVNNPPGDLGITGTTYILGGLYQNGGMLLNETSGTITCEGGSDSGFVYNCSIPFSITNYNHENAYYWKQNSITFDVSFSSGGQTITQELTTAFSDVTIPSHRCGDGTCNPEEDMVSCCFDCGCESDEYFCDKERGCKTMDSLRLEVSTVYPNQFDDCRKQHIVNMTAQIKNIPSDANLDYFNYIRGEEISGWTIECPQPNTDTGITNCRLFIPPIENCTIPAERIGPNELSLTISFGDGPRKTAKTMEDEFTDIYVRAIPKCGDGICETNLDESEETCCIDCLDDCIDRYNGEGYCDIPDPNFPEEGECKDKGDVQLRVIAPMGTTTFDSCEKTNRLSVRARIDGLPSDAQIGNWWAEVNGSSRSISCNQEQSFIGMPTWTFNCSIPISGVAGCKSGSSFTLPNNMLHVYLSFSNGRISMEKNTTFGNILLRQKYKTILEITREALEKSNATMRSILDKKKEMVENMKECAEMMKKLMIVSIVLGVVGAMGWLGPATSTTTALFGGKGMTGGIMGSLISGYQKWCEWQQKELENLIELEKMELCEIQMNLCMQTAQYALDAGNCGEIDIRCFQNQYSSMQSCTDTGMSCIDKSFQKISSNMQQMGTLAQGIVQDVQNFGAGIRALGTETDFGDAKLLIDGRPMSTDKICGVRYQRGRTTITAVGVVLGAEKETTIGARQNSGAVACPNLVFKLDGGETQKWPTDVKGTTREFFGVDAQGVHNIQVFCRESAVARATPVGGPIKVCFCNGGPITVGGVQYIGCTEENCKDAWSECTGSTPQATQLGQIPAPSATRSTGPGGLTANVDDAENLASDEQVIKDGAFKVTPTVPADVTDVVVHLDNDAKYNARVGPDGKASFSGVVEGVYKMYVVGKNKTSGQAVSSQNSPVTVLVDLARPSITGLTLTAQGNSVIHVILSVADSLGEGGTCTITWKGKTSNAEKNPPTEKPFTGKSFSDSFTVEFSAAENF